MSNRDRLYDDGTTLKQRSEMRHNAWANPDIRKRESRWTEKLCAHCKEWHPREEPETWCDGFKEDQAPPRETDAAIQVDRGYFNPNCGPGGSWLKNKDAERTAFKLYGIEPAH